MRSTDADQDAMHWLDEPSFEHVLADDEQAFSGWDFSYLTQKGRMQECPVRWNYTSMVERLMRRSQAMLDMGTGGGEFLASMQPLPVHTCATEGYPPNVAVARSRLEPLGVQVLPFDDEERLPFVDAQFDLVVNRHESFSARELWRILKPGGIFLTQQVGGDNDKEMNEAMRVPPFDYAAWTCEAARAQLEEAGFTVLKQDEERTFTRFYDLGAIVFYLKAIPWQIPEFSIEAYREPLEQLYERMSRTGYFDATCHRFYIVARKEAPLQAT